MTRGEAQAPPLQRRLLWGLLAAVMLAIGFTAVMAPRWTRPVVGDPPMTLGQAPEFSLINRDGRMLTNSDLLGSPWVANFIFTRCAISCPRMTQRMFQLESLWSAELDTARVSFSVDPDYDTEEVLQTYAESWGIEDSRWFFLTGEREIMKSIVMDGFKLALEMNPPPGSVSPGEPILHSTRFVLLDGVGAIRGYYDVVEGGELERLARDLRAIQPGSPGEESP
jgi:protein SCO1/2